MKLDCCVVRDLLPLYIENMVSDQTAEQIKQHLGDKVALIDGIAATLFDEIYPIEMLEAQARQIIDLFAGKLILGISDEMSSTGNIDRVKFITDLVDDYNAKH